MADKKEVALEIDTIHVIGSVTDRSVTISFLNVDLAIQPHLARELAFALMEEADKAEWAGGPPPCPNCGRYGCPGGHHG